MDRRASLISCRQLLTADNQRRANAIQEQDKKQEEYKMRLTSGVFSHMSIFPRGMMLWTPGSFAIRMDDNIFVRQMETPKKNEEYR
jgi:hypothetical protein